MMADESSKGNENLKLINLYKLDLSGLRVLGLAIPRTPYNNFGSSTKGCERLEKKIYIYWKQWSPWTSLD